MAKKRKIEKRTILGLIIVFGMLLLITNVSAYKRLCLTNGESVPSNQNPMYTCHSDMCQVCVTDNNYPTHPGNCNTIAGCGVVGPGSQDLDPPVLTVNSPIEGAIYSTRTVLFDLKMSEKSSILWLDNIAGRGMWKKIISNALYFNKGVSMSDGPKEITIKAVDEAGNSVEVVRKFYVDSIKPKIKKTLPTKGFADGNFQVELSELNPKILTLVYGNSQKGERSLNVPLANCILEKGVYKCNTNTNLGEFNEQEIYYKFILKDIADNVVESKPVTLSVDASPPVINNPSSMFTVQGRYVLFNISITETNFYDVSFMDSGSSRLTKLCSSLKNGLCIKKQSFKSGSYSINIKILDKAGNSVTRTVEFEIQ
jgi:hypothetical protein